MKKGTKVQGAKILGGELKYISPEAVLLNPKLLIREPQKDSPKFKELVESIKHHGAVLQPIILHQTDKGLELVAGRQRLAASQTAHIKAIPYVEVEGDADQLVSMALDENEARIQMSVMQEAQVLDRVRKLIGKEKAASNVAVAKTLNRPPHWVADHLALLELPKDIQALLDTGEDVTIGKCHELMRVHPSDRPAVMDMMRKMTLRPFRAWLEKQAKEGAIKWVGGKAKPRTEAAKKGEPKKGDEKSQKAHLKAKEAQYTGTSIKEKNAPECTVDMKTPAQVVKIIKKVEDALNAEMQKKPEAQDVAQMNYLRGQMHAYLTCLNLPAADTLNAAMVAFSAKKE